MPQTVLILGASLYHLPVIRAAREMGCRVLTADVNPQAPGHQRADRACMIPPFEIEALLDVVRAENVRGVLSATASPAFVSAALVSATAGLPGIAPEAADLLSDRLRFRELLTELGLPHVQTHRLREGARLPVEIFGGNRWVLKPDRGSASRGVLIVSSREEMEKHYPQTLGMSGGEGLLERLIQHAHSGVCQGTLRDGKVAATWFMDRTNVEDPYTTLTSLRMPARLPQHQRRQLIAAIEQVFQTLKVVSVVFCADYVAGEGKIYLMGIAPTLGGDCIPALVQFATGADLAQEAVRHALGETTTLVSPKETKPTAAVILGTSTAGKLRFDAAQAEACSELAWISGMTWDRPQGQSVQAFTDGFNRVGQLFVHAQDRDQLDARVTEVLRRLHLRAE